MKAASGDWPDVIRMAYFTGLRLQDVTNVIWKDIDFDAHLITVTPRKTASSGKKSKTVTVPLHTQLETALLSRPSTDSPNSPVFPLLAGKTTAGRSGLSMAFSRIMERAGVDGRVKRARSSQESGTKSLGRTVRARTFHALRHSFVSTLANQGVSLELRRALVGHADERMTEGYSHLEIQTLRQAVEKVPGLGI